MIQLTYRVYIQIDSFIENKEYEKAIRTSLDFLCSVGEECNRHALMNLLRN